MKNVIAELADTLKRLLPIPEKYSLSQLGPEVAPLSLLLIIQPDVVAFAQLNGNSEEDYNQALSIFRKIYAEKSSEWAEFDLTLVLCVEESKFSNEFQLSKEQDGYFCRKFVIKIGDKVAIDKELQRLPFLPLPLQGDNQKDMSVRTVVSAKKLLTIHGIKADLADEITVPYKKKANRIVSDILNDRYGEVHWNKDHHLSQSTSISDSSIDNRHRIRLQDIEINNFRAYRGNHKIDLDGDIVVLYGQNGLGKTSLFDAIDFVCTGGEAKTESREGSRDIKKAIEECLKHLDANVNESYVAASFRNNSQQSLLIKRSVGSRSNATIDGIKHERLAILHKLTGYAAENELSKLNTDKFIQLFRATHLFGQDLQSLTSKLNQQSILDVEIVSKMLALQDYVQGLQRIDEIIDILRLDIQKEELKLLNHSTTKLQLDNELKQLESSIGVTDQPDMIQAIGLDLNAQILGESNLHISLSDRKEFTKDTALDWRIKIETRLAKISELSVSLDNIEADFENIVSTKKQIIDITNEVVQLEKQYEVLKKLYAEQKKESDEAQRIIQAKEPEEVRLRRETDNLGWLNLAKESYLKLEAEIKLEEKIPQQLNAETLQMVSQYETLMANEKTIDEQIKQMAVKNSGLKNYLNELGAFTGTLSVWENLYAQSEQVNAKVTKFIQEIEILQGKRADTNTDLENELRHQNKLKEQIAKIQENRQALINLLDNIEKHIVDGTCPVCANVYRSQQELIDKLKTQRGKRPPELDGYFKDLNSSEGKCKQLKEDISSFEKTISKSQNEKAKESSLTENINNKINEFKEKAKKLRLPQHPSDIKLMITSKKDEIIKELHDTEILLRKNEQQKNIIKTSLADLLKRKNDCELKLNIAKKKKEHIQAQISSILKEASNKQVSLTATNKDIHDRIKANNLRLLELTSEIKILHSKVESLGKQLAESLASIDLLSKAIRAKKEVNEKLTTRVKQYEKRLTDLGLKPDATEAEMIRQKVVLQNEASRLSELLKKVLFFEVALVSVKTSAEVKIRKMQMESIEKTGVQLEKHIKKLKAHNETFMMAQRELEHFRKRALDNYISQYSPLASSIQKRLRKPFGFGDLMLKSGKGEIIVEVMRGEHQLRPSDYFSASQINIVALSIFMSAALTQTWSCFAPILMDDPVTHFDDLNAYSFIDLIRGIILSEEPHKGHQFIISTCDESLYRLMQQKFASLRDRAKFYAFQSFSDNGVPLIKSESRN